MGHKNRGAVGAAPRSRRRRRRWEGYRKGVCAADYGIWGTSYASQRRPRRSSGRKRGSLFRAWKNI